jgi:hypothetical protein
VRPFAQDHHVTSDIEYTGQIDENQDEALNIELADEKQDRFKLISGGPKS